MWNANHNISDVISIELVVHQREAKSTNKQKTTKQFSKRKLKQ